MVLFGAIVSMDPNCIVLFAPLDYFRIGRTLSTDSGGESNEVMPDLSQGISDGRRQRLIKYK